MTPQDLHEIITNLLNAGWTPQEIDERLQTVRQRHQLQPDQADQRHPDDALKERRLKFVRWLFTHDKISDWYI